MTTFSGEVMQNEDGNSGWNEWSKHVLAELKRLNENYESLRGVNEEIKQEMVKLSGLEENINNLKEWKSRVDDVMSPVQMAQLSKKVEDLEKFKTSATTILVVINSLMVFAIGIIGFIKDIF